MKRKIIILISMVFGVLALSSCVSDKRFKEFVEQVTYQHDILACESRVDLYEARTGSDEPDGTRRDEPLGTRRDEPSGTRRDLESCEAEFDRVVGGTAPADNYPKCQPKLVTCVEDTALGFPQCNACFDTCMTSVNGTWPDVTCELAP